MKLQSKHKKLLFWIILFTTIIGIYTIGQGGGVSEKVVPLTYSKFLDHVTENKIDSLTIKGDILDGTLKTGERFATYIPNDPNLIEMLKDARIEFNVQPPSHEAPSFFQIILPWLPLFIIIGIVLFAMKNMQPGGSRSMGFGRSRAKPMGEKSVRVTFNDVAGIDDAKSELQEIVEFLKNPKKFERLGGKIPRGVLLSGPPGSGKTLLARAIAGEAGVMFFSISGSDFVEIFVGVGASRVRDMFEQAKKNGPSIIFIDEIDAVGRRRNHGMSSGGNEEREQTLNALLVEMDGFEQNQGIIVVAATNRPDVLDPALLRPGRFDRRISITYPDIAGREKILKVHSKNVPLLNDIDLSIIAKGTPGFSGADLANLVNEAALMAAKSGNLAVSTRNLEEAKDKIIMGPARKSWILKEEEKKLVAYHEAGHATLAYYTEGAEPIHKVTIMPRGRALGMVVQLPEGDQLLISRKRAISDIIVAMGGRIAEEKFFGKDKATSGASNDIEQATKMARKMVTEWALSLDNEISDTFQNYAPYDPSGYGSDYQLSEDTKIKNDTKVAKILDQCYAIAVKTIEEHQEKLVKLAEALLVFETLNREEVINLFETGILPEREQEEELPSRRLPQTLYTKESDKDSDSLLQDEKILVN